MTPTLDGRLQTRIFLGVSVGVLWTAVIVPFLPEPAGVSTGMAYDMAFGSLLVMIVYGLVWELLYQALQQLRWDKDWPSLFALLSVLIEAPLVWILDFLFPIMSMSGSGMQMPGPMGPMSSSPGLPSPYLPAFAIHIGTTWAVMWLFSQGPMRVICVHWRFEGGRVLDGAHPESLPADGKPQIPRRAGASAGLPEATLSERARWNESAIAADLVQGITCGRGHFGYPGLRYCMICGVSLLPLTGTLVLGPRPPLGVLIFSDGTRYVVERDLRLAQEESGNLTVGCRDEIPAATALAEIRLAGWQPVVSSALYSIDVALPDGGSLRVAPGAVLATLKPGTEFMIGTHRIRYESPYQPNEPVPPAPGPRSRFPGGNGTVMPRAATLTRPPGPGRSRRLNSSGRQSVRKTHDERRRKLASRSAFRPASSMRSEAPTAAATVISNISSALWPAALSSSMSESVTVQGPLLTLSV
jgi:hypothetical protein